MELLAAEGLLSIKDIYVDGTKIEATSNRYTFVLGNAIKTSKEKIKKQLEELWNYAKNWRQMKEGSRSHLILPSSQNRECSKPLTK